MGAPVPSVPSPGRVWQAEKGKTITTSMLTPFLGAPKGPGELLSTLHPGLSHRGPRPQRTRDLPQVPPRVRANGRSAGPKPSSSAR